MTRGVKPPFPEKSARPGDFLALLSLIEPKVAEVSGVQSMFCTGPVGFREAVDGDNGK